MKQPRLTLQAIRIALILSTTARAFGIRWPAGSTIESGILESEFKDPGKFTH